MRKRRVMGIDPGATGGISLIGVDDDSYAVMPMPEGNEEIARKIFKLAQRWDIVVCYKEKVQSMQQNAGRAMLTYGQHDGYVMCTLFLAGVPVREITPQTWQKTVTGLIPQNRPKKPDVSKLSKKEAKDALKKHTKALADRRKQLKKNSVTLARQRFPKLANDLLISKDGLADALHIGAFGLSAYKNGSS